MKGSADGQHEQDGGGLRRRPASRNPEVETFVDVDRAREILLGRHGEATKGPVLYPRASFDTHVGRLQNAVEDVLFHDDEVPAPLREALECAHSQIMVYWETQEANGRMDDRKNGGA